MTPEKGLVLVIFVLTYAFLAISKRYRARAIWIAIGVLLAVSYLTGYEIISCRNLLADIHWNVIGIFAGTLLLTEVFIWSRVPALLSDVLVARAGTVGIAALGVCAIASFISVFVENVATVLIVAPIAIQLARRLKVSPVPFLIGIAISSNLQGTATLIGDPPSMILAAAKKMNFNEFIWYCGKPGIFFAVEVGAVASFAVLYSFFRPYRQTIGEFEVESPRSWTPTCLLCAMVVVLALSSLVDPDFVWFAGASCMGSGVAGLLWLRRIDRPLVAQIVRRYDWSTTFFLMGIFVLVAAIGHVGLLRDIERFMIAVVGTRPFVAYTAIVWFSVLFSAFIDNVPYITLMLPVVAGMSKGMNLPNDNLFAFGLLIGSCLGGNITPIGAAANIVSVGLAGKEGHPVGFMTFVRYGLPFTLAATLAGYLFLWFTWA